MSISGMSRPSLNRSTANRICSSPERRRRICSARCSRGLVASRAAARRPDADKLAGHPMGVLHAHAEAQGAHRRQVGDFVCQFGQDQAQAGVVVGVEVGEGFAGVAVAAPFDSREVGAVVEAEVVERASRPCSKALQRRSSAAMRPSNQWRMSSPPVRSGVAVRPRSSTGARCRSQRS